jgi:predicted dehydrogenase
VLVEKPIAANLEDATLLISIAEERRRILQVGHVERFNPVVEAATRVATSPQFFEAHRLSVFSMRSLDIDVVLDLMIHDIDVILSLVRSEVAEIRAAGIPVLSQKADIANVRIEFADGCVANITASRVSTDKVRKLRFFQPHDYVSIDYAAQQGYRLSLQGGRLLNERLDPPAREPLRVELESFVDAVRNRTPARVDGKAGLRALEVALAVNEEIERHRRRRESSGADREFGQR